MRVNPRRHAWRNRAATTAAMLVAAAGLATGQAATAHAAVACDVAYSTNDWQGGFTASVTVKNLGDALNGWTLGFTFTGGQKLQQGWAANWTQEGTKVTAKNLDWNGALATGASAGLGFNGSWTGSNPKPTDFTVNGVACAGQNPTNQAPTVSLTSPASGASYDAGAAVPLAATASDDGAVSKVEFYVDGELVNTDTTAPYSHSAAGLSSGSHTAKAKAYDNGSPVLSKESAEVPFTVGGGGGTPSIIASPTSVSVPEGGSKTVGYKLSKAPSGNVTVNLTKTGDADLTIAPATLTFTADNWNTAQNVAVSAAQDADEADGTATIAAAATGHTGVSVTATEADDDGTPPPVEHVDNPYEGATGYVNPNWSAKAAAEPGGDAVADISTGVWLDRIAAIQGSSSAMGLRAHLEEALKQDAANGGKPLTIQFVIYNLPNRDCSALASNGELLIAQNGLNRYKNEYIDPIAEIMKDPKYSALRIVTVVEIDSLPNLITNLNVPKCQEAKSTGAYVDGIRYALDKLHAIKNVYTYVDAAHHGWIGWDTNFGPTADLFASTVAGTAKGFDSVDGFITNTANYSALREPFFSIGTTVNGTTVRQSKWLDWNFYVDELSFAQAFRQELIRKGFKSTIGMLIDTSRNGWGGTARPTQASTSTNVDTFVDQSRVDRRIHAGNWCNQSGAGLGERPQANPAPGLDAYVWIKPPGESDGSSKEIPNNEGKGFDRMCDPTYTGNERNKYNMSGALPDAPISGQWFSAQFRELLKNAYPPVQ
ncbi:cellulose 1,4-beta-cellobiosidase [Streptosporangium becharense]|uniref:Glucanase n=1 Tax=Streptosporangium becharense TaxID=1816182 RepID=A0A7W9MJ93_9ACTN|nr:cellulose 1,4-beta-cellobiosidase [Streptosporangium becharense]MBB5822284.1 cellulose 1,4-beta-cellobiosidase [Streptosporangium becharense]